MGLKKQPETEMEYWAAIEGLGGYIWRMNHDMADGRIEDPKGEISKSVAECQEISARLVHELQGKFGVIQPSDCPKREFDKEPKPAPEGMTYYWDWYEKMKNEFYKAEYEGMICSACPFSQGHEQMVALGGVVPCSVFPGMAYSLEAPHMCAMKKHVWGEDQFYQKILFDENGGHEVLEAFQKKEEELKAAALKDS